MLVVEPARSVLERISNDMITCGLKERSPCDALSLPLFPSFADPHGLATLHSFRAAEFAMNQPQALREKSQQKQSRQKLRAAETFSREIWTHKVEPSVLPCRRRLREKFFDE